MLKESCSAKLCLLFSYFLSRSKSIIWMKDAIAPKINICQINFSQFTWFSSRSFFLPERSMDDRRIVFSVPALSFSLHLLFSLLWSKKNTNQTWNCKRRPAVIFVKVSKESKATQLKQHTHTHIFPMDLFLLTRPHSIFTFILISPSLLTPFSFFLTVYLSQSFPHSLPPSFSLCLYLSLPLSLSH